MRFLMSNMSDTRRVMLICLVLAVVTLSVFWQEKDHEFINFDDKDYVTENLYVRVGVTLEGITWAFTTFHACNWHPLTWLSHMLDVQLFGLKPGWHHLMNLLFHIANTLLLFLVLHRMTKALWPSAFTAALFALHPLHVESVAWVSERKDVLSTLFWLLTMGAYVFYVEKPEMKRYLFTLIFFALGLMAKPMLVTLPFVLLLLDYWPLKRFPYLNTHLNIPPEAYASPSFAKQKRKSKKLPPVKEKAPAQKPMDSQPRWTLMCPLVREKVPFFILLLLSSAITYMAQQKGGAVSSLHVIPFDVRIANAFVSYMAYIGNMIWPVNLAVFYPHPGMVPPLNVLAAVLALAMITFFAFRMARRFPYVIIGWLWYLGTLVPVIGLIQVGLQAMADRYSYIPFIGLFVIISWGMPDLLKIVPYRKFILGILSAMVIITLFIITLMQVQHWRNSIMLLRHTINVTSNNAVAYYTLGDAFQSKGSIEDAIVNYAEALRINPHYADAHNNLGTILRRKGHLEEARKHYSEAIRINPNHANAHTNIGNVLFAQGKAVEAAIHYSKVISIDRNLAEAHYGIGNILIAQNKTLESIHHFQEALRINPRHVEALTAIGDILAQENRMADAVDYYNEALQINHDLPEIHYNLGNILSAQRSFERAVIHLREAIRIRPDYAKAHNNLGSVLLLQGEKEDAIIHFREALRLKPDYAMAQENLRNALAMQRKSR